MVISNNLYYFLQLPGLAGKLDKKQVNKVLVFFKSAFYAGFLFFMLPVSIN